MMVKIKAAYNAIKIFGNMLFSSKGMSYSDENAKKFTHTTDKDKYPNRLLTSKEYDFKKIVK